MLFLSLLVWYLPGLLVFWLLLRAGWLPAAWAVWGIAVLLVNPYYGAVFAELYLLLRDRAVKQGRIDRKELSLPVRHKQGR